MCNQDIKELEEDLSILDDDSYIEKKSEFPKNIKCEFCKNMATTEAFDHYYCDEHYLFKFGSD